MTYFFLRGTFLFIWYSILAVVAFFAFFVISGYELAKIIVDVVRDLRSNSA